MLKSSIIRVVDLCVRRPWWIIALSLGLCAGSGVYAARHFAIKTDINDLLSPDLPWAQRGLQYAKDFPQREILAVVDAPTPEIAEQATTRLAQAIKARPDRPRAVGRPGGGTFFRPHGLLLLPAADVAS